MDPLNGSSPPPPTATLFPTPRDASAAHPRAFTLVELLGVTGTIANQLRCCAASDAGQPDKIVWSVAGPIH